MVGTDPSAGSGAKTEEAAVVFYRCLSGPALEVAKLKSDSSYLTEEDRVRAFVASGAGCRATYFNHAKRLRPSEDVPMLKLTNTTLPQPAVIPENLVDLLRQRFGKLGSG